MNGSVLIGSMDKTDSVRENDSLSSSSGIECSQCAQLRDKVKNLECQNTKLAHEAHELRTGISKQTEIAAYVSCLEFDRDALNRQSEKDSQENLRIRGENSALLTEVDLLRRKLELMTRAYHESIAHNVDLENEMNQLRAKQESSVKEVSELRVRLDELEKEDYQAFYLRICATRNRNSLTMRCSTQNQHSLTHTASNPHLPKFGHETGSLHQSFTAPDPSASRSTTFPSLWNMSSGGETRSSAPPPSSSPSFPAQQEAPEATYSSSWKSGNAALPVHGKEVPQRASEWDFPTVPLLPTRLPPITPTVCPESTVEDTSSNQARNFSVQVHGVVVPRDSTSSEGGCTPHAPRYGNSSADTSDIGNGSYMLDVSTETLGGEAGGRRASKLPTQGMGQAAGEESSTAESGLFPTNRQRRGIAEIRGERGGWAPGHSRDAVPTTYATETGRVGGRLPEKLLRHEYHVRYTGRSTLVWEDAALVRELAPTRVQDWNTQKRELQSSSSSSLPP